MKKGICVKCGLPAVCTAEMGFQQNHYTLPLGDSIFSGIMNVKLSDFVCTECGYHEQYIVEAESREKIAELSAGNIKGWAKVAVS
jgi:predicted nucleic-acid-binding Zn-ribbon protein